MELLLVSEDKALNITVRKANIVKKLSSSLPSCVNSYKAVQ